MATHYSSLAWKMPWTEELGAGYCPWGRKELGTTERLHFISLNIFLFVKYFLTLHFIPDQKYF